MTLSFRAWMAGQSAVVPAGKEQTLLPLLRAAISAHTGWSMRWVEEPRDVLVLRRAAGAPPLPAASGGEPLFMSLRGRARAVRQPVTELIAEVARRLEKIVLDETGLNGLYDWEMPYQPGQPDVTIKGLTALGLELVPALRPTRILVVE